MIGYVLWQFYYCITNSIVFFMAALIAVNFFGYSVTLTKKRVIVITIVMSVIITANLSWPSYVAPLMNPKLYEAMRTGNIYVGAQEDYKELSAYITMIQRLVFYSFAAIVYYILFVGK